MKQVLHQLFEHKQLDRATARDVLENMSQGKYNESEIAAFLTVYLMRSITLEELAGFRDALLGLCLPVNLGGYNTIDLCGTGGDAKHTFNISTLAVFVVAGAGGHVAKHGNYGISSASGSSNVMQYFGYAFHADESRLRKEMDASGVCFLHAPLFHPALKNVAPVRRQLGVKTFFNMLGPMVNPSLPPNQLVGVFSLELARLYTYLYQQTDKKFTIVHSLDGYDEVSLTSPVKVMRDSGEQVLSAADFLAKEVVAGDLYGGSTVESAAQIFKNVLDGNGTPGQNSVVIANAALALECVGISADLGQGLAAATESLLSGKAKQKFEQLLQANQS